MTEYINSADFEDLLSKKDADRLIEVLERGGTRALQMEAADALGKLGDNKAIEPLVKIINVRYWAIQVRISAVKALGRIGGEEGRKALEELATFEDMHGWTDEVEAIRETAKTALKLIA